MDQTFARFSMTPPLTRSLHAEALVFDDVRISYEGRRAAPVLDSFSLSVEPGDFLSIVGPSGCGKSSLLHAAGGFIRPVRGTIRLGSEHVTRPTSKIGIVSQRFGLFPWLTAEANIAFGMQAQGYSREVVRESVNDLLKFIGLSDHRFDYPDQLSGGMQQRVALARAMAPRPCVLLLDEPFASLDSETRGQMQELLMSLWTERRMTVLFVTHQLEEAIFLGDHLLMLSIGRRIKMLNIDTPRPRRIDLKTEAEFRGLMQMATQFYEQQP